MWIQVIRYSDILFVVAYVCHHLSDNYVDLSDNYVNLSDNDFDEVRSLC